MWMYVIPERIELNENVYLWYTAFRDPEIKEKSGARPVVLFFFFLFY